MADAGVAPLPRAWRLVFAVEIPLVAGTVVYWLVAPATYLHDAVGVAAPRPPDVLLLRLYAGSVASLALVFYTWLLAQPRVHQATFRAFQVCLGVGDAAIVAASLAYWAAASDRRLLAAQLGMAAFWGMVRAVFVVQRGGGSSARW